MSEVRVDNNESIEVALRRFLRKCQESGVVKEVKNRRAYEKPSAKKKRKLAENLRKLRKRTRRENKYNY
ncbi:30S ribosomal protein S21 [Candidatus Riflebacteria bacterium]